MIPKVKDFKIVNDDEICDYILKNVPSEKWVGIIYTTILVCCNLPLIRKFPNALAEIAGYSIVCRKGKYLEELIALGLDINSPIPDNDYGGIPIMRGDEELIIRDTWTGNGQKYYNISLLELACMHKNMKVIRILLRNGVNINNPHFSGLDAKRYHIYVYDTLSIVSTNRCAARTLIGIRKFRKIYPHIDRFIFREIAISIWSSRDNT
jgi:hypothetical protein